MEGMKIAFILCDNCNFIVVFTNQTGYYFYCREHKSGVTPPAEDLNDVAVCDVCKQIMEKVNVFDDDNACPICQGMIGVGFALE